MSASTKQAGPSFTTGAYYTSGIRTQVAKRKRANLLRNIAKAYAAAVETGEPAILWDFLTWRQMRMVNQIEAAAGKSITEIVHDHINARISEELKKLEGAA